MCAPVCPKLPVEANDFYIGHRECLMRRLRESARNPDRASVGRHAALPARWRAELALAKAESDARIAAMKAEHEALLQSLREEAAAWRAELVRAVFGDRDSARLAHWQPDPASRPH
jgi:hypothetical protein